MAICLTIIIAFIDLYSIYKSSFMNENPFSRISNPLSLGFTRKRGLTRVINFLVHSDFRKYIFIAFDYKKSCIFIAPNE